MSYNDMPAGAEIDRLIAEKVMGWQRHIGTWTTPDKHAGWFKQEWADGMDGPFSPSTNIAHAWMVVEKLHDMKVNVDMRVTNLRKSGCMLQWGSDRPVFARCESIPLAICRAALMAIASAAPKGDV